MPVVCTLLVETLPEEPEKSIFNLVSKTAHYFTVHDFPDKWTDILLSLMDPVQFLWVCNSHPALRKVRKQYEYNSFPLLLPLAISLRNPKQHSLEEALLSNLWSPTHFYFIRVKGGSYIVINICPHISPCTSDMIWCTHSHLGWACSRVLHGIGYKWAAGDSGWT